MSIRVLLADDHEMMRAGLRSILEKVDEVQVVAEASDGRVAVRLAGELKPNVVLMDITMPNLNGIEATRQIADDGASKVIALSIHCERAFVIEMLAAGASGYLLKNSACAELMTAIRAVHQGDTYLSPKVAGLVVQKCVHDHAPPQAKTFTQLTPREREVLQLLAEGKSNKEMAGCLNISSKTVETHRAQLMEKLGIFTVAELTKYAIREGLTSLEA
jgi:DNA-binding NarL/FixJ family response regulator